MFPRSARGAYTSCVDSINSGLNKGVYPLGVKDQEVLLISLLAHTHIAFNLIKDALTKEFLVVNLLIFKYIMLPWLTDDLLIRIMSDWLDEICLCNLDTAISCSHDRRKFTEDFKSMYSRSLD